VPVDEARLIGLVRQGLPEGEVIGVALSGGGDSTALLHLSLAAGLRVEAVTVDHRLRDGSAAEAAAVARDCAALGVPHALLVWDHGPEVAGNLMDQARRARMSLIADWARGRGIAHVALGHTRDDQAETVLMGLARAAGVAGLSGMRRDWEEGGVTFHRPLLDAGREELRDWLRARGLAWVDDPTNDNTRFTRVKARRVLAALAPLGITAERLAAVAGHLGQARDALAVLVRDAALRNVVEVAGALKVGPGLWEAPGEVQRQVLAAAVGWLSQAPYLPRAEDLGRLQRAMAAGRDATLHGCRHHKGWLLREARAAACAVPVGEAWDGRWRVSGAAGEVRLLGPAGLRQCPDWRAMGLPRQVLEVTPAVWQGDLLIAAPSAGFGPATATCAPGFHASLLSH
jgi:tRNA(Ile)-lysidine synthase